MFGAPVAKTNCMWAIDGSHVCLPSSGDFAAFPAGTTLMKAQAPFKETVSSEDVFGTAAPTNANKGIFREPPACGPFPKPTFQLNPMPCKRH